MHYVGSRSLECAFLVRNRRLLLFGNTRSFLCLCFFLLAMKADNST